MKQKIFEKLKTKYSYLGLGDEILQSHAEMLASLGFVTEDNMDTIVEAQKKHLEDLQKANDKRANEAAETAKKNAKKEFEEEQAKKDAEAKAAEEKAKKDAEAKAAAEKAAKEAEEKAKKEAEEKAKKEEEEKRKLEEMKKNDQIPDYAKKMQEELVQKIQDERKNAENERNAFKEMLEAMQKSNKEQTDALLAKLTETSEQNKTLNETITAMKAESDQLKAEREKKNRQEKILSIAKELNIPQYRIDEGLPITDDMDEDAIRNKLNTVAVNCKAVMQSRGGGFPLGGGNHEVSQEEIKAVASKIVKK